MMSAFFSGSCGLCSADVFSAATNLFYCVIVGFVTPLLEAVAKEQHNNNRLFLSLSL